jgi:hypothetical protein
MQTIVNYIIPVAILIFFVIVFLKFRKKAPGSAGSPYSSGGTASSGSGDTQMPKLAEMMGLKFEDASLPSSEKMLMNSGSRLRGEYRGVNVDIIMGGYAKEAEFTPLTAAYSYEYKITKEFNFEVSNTMNKSFEIILKNNNIVSQPTGVFSFDSVFSYIGDLRIPDEYLDYFGMMGWMNLKLSGNVLKFTDSFFEDTMATKGTMSAVGAINPIWKCSARNFNIDFENVIDFINKIIDMIEVLNIKKQ